MTHHVNFIHSNDTLIIYIQQNHIVGMNDDLFTDFWLLLSSHKYIYDHTDTLTKTDTTKKRTFGGKRTENE